MRDSRQLNYAYTAYISYLAHCFCGFISGVIGAAFGSEEAVFPGA